MSSFAEDMEREYYERLEEEENERKEKNLEDLLVLVKELTDYILGSYPTTTIQGKIESLALAIGHHNLILNRG